MTERGLRWARWSRGIRARWESRRVQRTHGDFVWLHQRALRVIERTTCRTRTVRPNVRLSLHVSISARSSPLIDYVQERLRTFHGTVTPVLIPLHMLHVHRRRERVSVSSWIAGSPGRRAGFGGTALAPDARAAGEAGRHAWWRSASTGPRRWAARRVRSAAPPMRLTLIPASSAGLGLVGPTQARREASRIPPPRMVVRAPRRESATHPAATVSAAPRAGPRPEETVDVRAEWPSLARPNSATTWPPAALSAITDHVVRQINDRVRAKRERLGKV